MKWSFILLVALCPSLSFADTLGQVDVWFQQPAAGTFYDISLHTDDGFVSATGLNPNKPGMIGIMIPLATQALRVAFSNGAVDSFEFGFTGLSRELTDQDLYVNAPGTTGDMTIQLADSSNGIDLAGRDITHFRVGIVSVMDGSVQIRYEIHGSPEPSSLMLLLLAAPLALMRRRDRLRRSKPLSL